MNVIRMIKLFGWEPKIKEQIGQKRDEELVWIMKRQLLDLLNGNVKYVLCYSHTSSLVILSNGEQLHHTCPDHGRHIRNIREQSEFSCFSLSDSSGDCHYEAKTYR